MDVVNNTGPNESRNDEHTTSATGHSAIDDNNTGDASGDADEAEKRWPEKIGVFPARTFDLLYRPAQPC